MKAELIFSGSSEPIPLTKDRFIVGRSLTSDIPVEEKPVDGIYAVSRRHLQLERESDVWFVKDLGSSNGTKINGRPLLEGERRVLLDGDEIEIGQRVKAVFRQPEEDDRTVRSGQNQRPSAAPAPAVTPRAAAPQRAAEPPRAPAAPQRAAEPREPAAPRAAAARPTDVPASLGEYIDRYGSAQIKKQIKLGMILEFVAVGISVIVMFALNSPAMLLDIALVLPLAILVFTKKSKGCATALLVINVIELIFTVISSGKLGGWLPLIGSISAFQAIRKADAEYQQLRSMAAAGSPVVHMQAARPAPEPSPARTPVRETPVSASRQTVSVVEPGAKLDRSISLQIEGSAGWREGRAEISNEQIVLYAKGMMTRVLFGAIGAALSSGKEVMRFSPGDIRAYTRTKDRQLRLELRSQQAVNISGKKDVIDLFVRIADAAGARAQ